MRNAFCLFLAVCLFAGCDQSAGAPCDPPGVIVVPTEGPPPRNGHAINLPPPATPPDDGSLNDCGHPHEPACRVAPELGGFWVCQHPDWIPEHRNGNDPPTCVHACGFPGQPGCVLGDGQVTYRGCFYGDYNASTKLCEYKGACGGYGMPVCLDGSCILGAHKATYQAYGDHDLTLCQ